MKHYCFLTYGPVAKNPGFIRPRQLGKELVRLGVKVTYLIDDYAENHGDLGIDPQAQVIFVPQPRSFGQVPARRRIIRGLGPAFVHVHYVVWRSCLALAAQPTVRVFADWDEPNYLKDLPWPRRQTEKLLAWWLRRRSDRALVSSRHLRKLFRQWYGIEATYLPYATYLTSFPEGPSPFDVPTAVYLGSMNAMWDMDLLFDAFALLGREGFRPPVTLVGDGPDVPRWKEFCRAHALDNLRFVGYQPDEQMMRFLRHGQVLLFPIRPTLTNLTRNPSKIFAYAQARRPIITSRVGEVAEVLGDKAIYADPTPENFAAAIRRAMEQARLPDVDYGVERYTYADRARELLRLMEECESGENA